MTDATAPLPAPLARRVAATQEIVDTWRGRPFVWGTADCARLAAAMLTRLGWKPGLARGGYYKTALGAAKAFRRAGFADAAAWMDDVGLFRIPPAAALPGDILGFAHADMPLGVALVIAVGNGRAFGFADNGDGPRAHVFPPILTADGGGYLAWRAEPR